MNILDQVISVHEAACLLGVTPRHVRRLCESGKLHARYADGIWLILKSSL